MYGSGIMVGKTNGSRASRWRITFRTLITAFPLLTVMVLVKLFNPGYLTLESIELWQGMLITMLVFYFGAALLAPRRGLHDLISIERRTSPTRHCWLQRRDVRGSGGRPGRGARPVDSGHIVGSPRPVRARRDVAPPPLLRRRGLGSPGLARP